MSKEIQKLINGNKQFIKKFFRPNNTFFNNLVLYGQQPKTMVISCSDSRIDPNMIFNCQPGELFVVRNVANLIPPCEDNATYHGTSAALEFGTCFLNVENIIILGHTRCGGIQYMIENAEKDLNNKNYSFITKWMELASPAYKRVMNEQTNVSSEEKFNLCERYALINSLDNLKSFPWIQERINNNVLSIHAWYFDLATGKINMYNHETNFWL